MPSTVTLTNSQHRLAFAMSQLSSLLAFTAMELHQRGVVFASWPRRVSSLKTSGKAEKVVMDAHLQMARRFPRPTSQARPAGPLVFLVFRCGLRAAFGLGHALGIHGIRYRLRFRY